MYPAKTVDKIGLKEDKRRELFSFENLTKGNITYMPLELYDMLLDFGYGEKCKCIKNVRFDTGKITKIK